MKAALFDDEGKCIGIYSGEQDLSVLDYAYAAEIDGQITPNEAHYNREKDEVEKRPHIIPPRPPRTEPSIPERIAALEEEIKKLKEKK